MVLEKEKGVKHAGATVLKIRKILTWPLVLDYFLYIPNLMRIRVPVTLLIDK